MVRVSEKGRGGQSAKRDTKSQRRRSGLIVEPTSTSVVCAQLLQSENCIFSSFSWCLPPSLHSFYLLLLIFIRLGHILQDHSLIFPQELSNTFQTRRRLSDIAILPMGILRLKTLHDFSRVGTLSAPSFYHQIPFFSCFLSPSPHFFSFFCNYGLAMEKVEIKKTGGGVVMIDHPLLRELRSWF